MSANPLVVSLSNLLKPHEEQHELKKDLIGQVVKLIMENTKLKVEVGEWKEIAEKKNIHPLTGEIIQPKDILNLQKEVYELKDKLDSMESEVLDAQDSYALQKQTDQVYYHGEPLKCIEDGEPITISDVFPNKFIKENKELQKKVYYREQVIKNNSQIFQELVDEIDSLKHTNELLRDDFCRTEKKLEKEIKGLKNGGGDYISREEHQRVADILNGEAEMYKVKFMEATGQL